MRPYTRLRRSVQGAFALLFLAMPFIGVEWLGGTAIALRVGRVDVVEPTSALSAVLAAGALAAVTVVGVLPFVAATFAWGSVFCGWLCPYGLLSEGLDRLRHGRARRWAGRPATARAPRFALLAAILLLSLVAAVPLAAVLAPPRLVSALPLEARVLASVPLVTTPLLAFVIALDLLVSRRIVCRVLCPAGAGAALMRAPFTWRPRHDAVRCTCAATPLCQTACNWGLDPRHLAWSDGCTACLACVEQCPSGALQLRTPKPHPTEER